MDLPLPIPPRFRWLKRLCIASATLLLALIALRLTWGSIAHARLQREIDRHRATGQPVTLEEFNELLAAVPPEDNAAILYEQAMDILVITAADGADFYTFLNDDDTPAPFITRPAAAAELFTKNAPARDLIRKARDRSHVARSGGLNPNSWMIHNPQRQLAKSLAFAARHHFHTGNHEQAIETLVDFHHFNRAVAAHPSVIASLTAWASDALAYDLITAHAATLSLTSDPAALSNHCPANRTQINRLIELYLDEDSARQLAARGRRGDAAMMNSLFHSSGYIAGFFGVTGLPHGFRILEELVDVLVAPVQAVESLQTYTREYLVSKVVGELDWPQGSELLISSDTSPNLIDALAFPQSRSPFRSPAKSNQQSANIFYRHLATRRMAAIALAIRLYELDHGHRPVELTALVPDYFPALPSDPFATTGTSFQYAYEFPYDQARAYLYTIGANGLDNGGVLQDPLTNRSRSADDMHFFLDPEPLFIPPVPLPTRN